MNWSSYQQTVFEALRDSEKHLLIEAVAGSGKTTTLIECIRRAAHPEKKTLCLAFNKSVQLTLTERLQDCACQISTFHSYGFSLIYPYRFKFEKDKTKKAVIYRYGKVPDVMERLGELIKAIGVLKVDLKREQPWETKLAEALETFRIDPIPEATLKPIWEDDQNSKEINFDDMIYRPVLYTEDKSHIIVWPKFDMIFVDEVQDLSPVQVLMLKYSMKPTSRLICVGDKGQQIYGFRGALGGFELILSAFDPVRLPLSVSYRCKKRIIEEAKRVHPQIEPYTDLPGVVSTRSRNEMITDLSKRPEITVLCRNNAPIIDLSLELFQQRIPNRIQGVDEGAIVKILRDFSKWNETNAKDLGNQTMIQLFDAWSNRKREQLRTQKRYNALEQFEELGMSARAILSMCASPKEALDLVAQLFSSDKGVKLSTIHKAKGQEYPVVYLLEPDLLDAKDQSGWVLEQERNLKYVAITRAIEEFYYVY